MDGSPTLRSIHIMPGSTVPESMHNTFSASGETEFIYGKSIRQALTAQTNLNFLIVGLGLGYIEILILSLVKNCQIHSFESDSELRKNFSNWILNSDQEFEIYNQVCRSLNLKPEFIREQINQNQFYINPDLNVQTVFKSKSHIICFDVFSRKTSESLWTEQFLNYFISKACSDDCIFISYSCTSLLNRVLINHGFKLIQKSGYNGKRESTLAVRGTLNVLFNVEN